MVFFDVTITDAEGNEIQPNTEFGEATVKMANVDLVENYLEAQEGEDSEDGDKSAELKVYHFDENMESAETPEVQVDGSDKAMTVNVGHFSVVGALLSTQAAATAIKDKWDDGSLYLKFSGGDFYVDTETNNKVITVSVNKNSTANYATIEVSGSTTKCLEIKPYRSDVPDVNVVLNGVSIHANYEKNNNNFGALTLDNCNTVLTLNKGKNNILENSAGTGHGIFLTNKGARLVIEQEDGADSDDQKNDRRGNEVLAHDRFHGLKSKVKAGGDHSENQKNKLHCGRYFNNECRSRKNRCNHKADDQHQIRHAGLGDLSARKAFDAVKNLAHHCHLLL